MDEDIKSLIEKNTQLVQTVYEQNRKIKHRLTMMVIGSYVRLGLVLLPIILAVIFLPPVVEKIWAQYGGLLRGFGIPPANSSSAPQLNQLPLDKVINNASPDQIKSILNQLGIGR